MKQSALIAKRYWSRLVLVLKHFLCSLIVQKQLVGANVDVSH